MPVIMKVRNAKKEYQVGDSTVHAVDGVSFSVNKGDWVLIYGRSGSGKSTLLNLLAGLEPPTEGEILIRGKHIEKMSEGPITFCPSIPHWKMWPCRWHFGACRRRSGKRKP